MSINASRYAACLVAVLLLFGCGGAGCKDCDKEAKREGCGAGCPARPDDAIHIHHSTFFFQFAPPWFNADQRSLLTSYVVFPEEAKWQDWLRGKEGCAEADAPFSVCPERDFYQKAMGPFLEGLARCGTKAPVELVTVGFASSTVARTDAEAVTEQYRLHIDAVKGGETSCVGGELVANETDTSRMFNLLIANQRADNAAAMLNGFLSDETRKAFSIKSVPWCSYDDMKRERLFNDQGDGAKGLINRRVEVRLKSLPGCVNVDPDKRIDVTM